MMAQLKPLWQKCKSCGAALSQAGRRQTDPTIHPLRAALLAPSGLLVGLALLILIPWAGTGLYEVSVLHDMSAALERGVVTIDPPAPASSLSGIRQMQVSDSLPDVLKVSGQQRPPSSLIPAPISAQQEALEDLGSLPRISAEGVPPWHAYARPFDLPYGKSSMALLLVELDFSREALDRAIRVMPREVAFGFLATAPDLQAKIDRSRAAGHEVVLLIPMQGEDFPLADPGPGTLLSGLPTGQNRTRLLTHLARGSGYFAVAPWQGEDYLRQTEQMSMLMSQLADRGLAWIGPVSGPAGEIAQEAAARHALTRSGITGALDDILAPEVIDQALDDLVQQAMMRGHALKIARATPLTLDRISRWLARTDADTPLLVPPSARLKTGGHEQD